MDYRLTLRVVDSPRLAPVVNELNVLICTFPARNVSGRLTELLPAIPDKTSTTQRTNSDVGPQSLRFPSMIAATITFDIQSMYRELLLPHSVTMSDTALFSP